MTQIQSFFESSAQTALFFTPKLRSVTGYRRRGWRAILENLWTVTTSREIIKENVQDELELYKVQVDASAALSDTITDQWLVSSRRINIKALPSEYKLLSSEFRLPQKLDVGLVAKLPLPSSSTPEQMTGKLFAGMPTPQSSRLPVHINASFILAPDRRSIRWSTSSTPNIQADYNRWLLRQIPLAYAFLLSNAPGTVPSNHYYQWWPKPTQASDVASVIAQSFYDFISELPSEPLFLDLQGQRLSPQDAFISGKEPQKVTKILTRLIMPPKLVTLPTNDLRSRILGMGSIPKVDKAFVQEAIASCAGRITHHMRTTEGSQYALVTAEIKVLVRYLAPNNLEGLPLLPLASGSELGTFTASTTAPKYYVLTPELAKAKADKLFPPERFTTGLEILSLTSSGLNIRDLDSSTLRSLIIEKISRGTERRLSDEEAKWVDFLWSEFPALQENMQRKVDLTGIPLVLTTSGRHISIEKCRELSVLPPPPPSDVSWSTLLENLGASFIEHRHYNYLQMAQMPEAQRQFSLSTVMEFLNTRNEQQIARMRTNSDDIPAQEFRVWFVDQLTSLLSWRDLPPIARQLPIWEAVRNHPSDRKLVSANELKMLPPEVDIETAAPFLNRNRGYFSQYRGALERLGVTPLTLAQFGECLETPISMVSSDIDKYRPLLELIIRFGLRITSSPMVPNRSGKMVRASELYSSSDPVFRAAFQSRTSLFLHEELVDLESGLVTFGLHGAVDMDSFVKCAEVIDQDFSPDVVGRASALFHWYSVNLPIFLAGSPFDPSQQWRRLDKYHFIPTHRNRREGAPDTWTIEFTRKPSEHELRSPMEILRPECEAHAWTQRARFSIPPNPRLFMANTNLGIPTTGEIVSVSRRLAEI
jgi:hypothetical protein